MLFQSLSALCLAPGGSGSIWKYLGALVRSTGVPGRFACGFWTALHFADVYLNWLQEMIESNSGCTQRCWSTEYRHELEGNIQVGMVIGSETNINWHVSGTLGFWPTNFEMHLNIKIEGTQRFTWSAGSCKHRATQGGCNASSVELLFEMITKWTQRWTWRVWSFEVRDSLWGDDEGSWDIHLDALLELD